MKPAIFLDRDGVITKETGKIALPDEVELLPFVKEAVEIIHDKGYYAIVVSNQSGVARGLFLEEELLRLHDSILNELNLDKIYYCPHYENGIVHRYSIKCNCRKPETGMIKKASDEFNIDLSRSWVVGDRFSDIILGKNAGICTCLIKSIYLDEVQNGSFHPDIILDSLLDFANHL